MSKISRAAGASVRAHRSVKKIIKAWKKADKRRKGKRPVSKFKGGRG